MPSSTEKSLLRADFGLASSESYFTFSPRPDQPDRFDEQASAYYSKTPGVTFIMGGNGAGTTEIALAKVASFVLADQKPPRADTPFWIISDTYETVCEACWKEKLLGHGHIPPTEIDWERIQWHKMLRGWPLAVPLKPWPDTPGRNWVLEFKSYKQGRQLMQARSIGGFCFCEQFPWILLTEVLRGCREYAFRGNKICEFTPIEPGLTEQLEEMLERDTMPRDWEVWRMNTQCALEAGHVTKEWFDNFFGMVPESMRETRMTGAMPTYEGAIYSNFNIKIHCIEICEHPFPPGVVHRRWIDWGSGPDNAFCCLWAYRNTVGQWFVYDEYYSTDLTRSVIDHLCAIHDRWPWPPGNPHYGIGWADPSGTAYFRIAAKLSLYAPKDREGKPLYKNLPLSAAANAVIPGIEHVQYLLKPLPSMPPPFEHMPHSRFGYPQLFIDRTNCPNLKRQMRTYRWVTKNPAAMNAKDAKPEPLKMDDHAVDALRYGVFSEAGMTIGEASSMHSRGSDEDRGIQFRKNHRHGIRFKAKRIGKYDEQAKRGRAGGLARYLDQRRWPLAAEGFHGLCVCRRRDLNSAGDYGRGRAV